MTFQKGNQYAKGHGFGRPRKIPQSDDELEQIGIELIDWCHADPINNLTFALFHTQYGILRKEWKCIIQIPVFLPFYEQARAILSINFLNGNVNPSIAHRYIRIYDRDVAEEEDEVTKLKSGAVVEAMMNSAELKEQTVLGLIKQADRLE